ncbi:hypothetical protein [Pararhodonellum marinum]|uniref:hypothetical protein n=1 Tax=Pararhodonellum marinum TaxID=2755358 RepID=UPI00188F0148|nr:hypothetical protein [Pararhodonellum marinum]
MDQILLVNLPKNISYEDFKVFQENIPEQLRHHGFLEIWDNDYHELELKSAGIYDFTTDRMKKALYDALGVIYLLDVKVLEKKPFRYGKLTALSEYGNHHQRNVVGGSDPIQSSHRVTMEYTLYRTDFLDTVARVQVLAEHKDNNTLNPRVLQRDISLLFQKIYESEAY